MSKLYDLAVKTGTYTTRSGEQKGRWKTIGAVLQTKDGGKVIVLDRTFNPAGVPVEDGRDQVMISLFEPRERDGQEPRGMTSKERQEDFEDDIAPF